ncbi:MAG: pyridoxal-dependent decarboxylase [Gemmatimonadota bacterium]|nr:pyridoxal-dependent decarboxylase [Gemmatimonadota bacterium]
MTGGLYEEAPDPRERIRELEALGAELDPGVGERGRLLSAVAAYAERFLGELPDRPAFRTDDTAAAVEEPGIGPAHDIETLLRVYDKAVAQPGLNAASAGHVAYIPGGGVYAASLGDYVAAVTNEYAGVSFASPGGVKMENLLLDWMRDLIGYPESARGNLAAGGSVASLVAVHTARDATGLSARDVPDAVVYATSHVHHCLRKALRVAGLGETVWREVPLDDRYRMRADALAELVAIDRERGLRPWLVLGSAGTTDVGAIDPLDAIADVAEAEDLWFHVDAAYGGFFALVDAVRPRLSGMERADSCVLDPHKTLFLPYGTGAVLVRDGHHLAAAHTYDANYMQDAAHDADDSPADLSHELTKHFRGPRLWLPLLLHGVEPFRANLEEKIELTRYFHREAARRGFEVGPDPELSVALYRWVPDDGDANDFNRALTSYVHDDGRVFVSSTLVDDVFVLRAAIVVFRTHLEHIDLLLDVLEEGVAELTAHPERWRPAVRA